MDDSNTPMNPDRDDTRAASSLGQAGTARTSPWQHFVGGIDLTQDHADAPSHPDGELLDTQGEAIGVKVSRNSGKAEQVIWTKEVHASHRKLGRLAGCEIDNLTHLRQWYLREGHSVLAGHVARFFLIVQQDLARGSAGVPATTSMIQAGEFDTSQRVETLHAGVTLDRLMHCGLCRDATDGSHLAGRRFSHSLAPPLNLLRLILKVVQALAALDDVGVYHCDMSFRNIAVPAESTPLEDDDGKGYALKLEWGKAKLIDFGLSCLRHCPPR